jgi:hypothetical protein
MTFSYFGYGLGFRSYLPLPELVEGAAGRDVRVLRGAASHSPPESVETDFCVRADGTEASLTVVEVGRFLVSGGRKVVVEPTAGAEDGALRLCILGRVLALLLHQRGLLALHGSAVTIGGGAAVFLGHRGWGKSTTAAALHRRGHGVLADDVVALKVSEGSAAQVIPGFPQLKLWPDAADWLGDAPEELPRLHPLSEKRARRVTRGFSHALLPLRRVYVLAEGPRPEVEPLRPREAFAELIRHSHAARYARLLEETRTAAAHFGQCALVAGSVAVCRLKRPRSLAALSSLAEAVEEDLAETS